ncbi:hypothetical protein [Microcoleus sp. B13-B6]
MPVPHKYHFYQQARCLFHTSTIFMNRQDACSTQVPFYCRVVYFYQ